MSLVPDGMFGASLISLKPELAAALKLEMGVLVEQVPEETPAYKAGLRVGDVITNVAGVAVSNVRDVRVLVMNRAENKSIGLQIVRDKKPKQLIVKW
jgi:S1-C subfamily serine protease